MKRHPKKQARYTTSRFSRFVDSVNAMRHEFGGWFYMGALLLTLSLAGGLNHLTTTNEASAATHDIEGDLPDGITRACWYKVLRSYRTQSTMDAYETDEVIAEATRMDRIAATCKDQRFDD